ncbi:substrate-binding protein [Bordetella pertussis]|nr:substrate-binding protein [Bordetella pertussis]CFE04152.1 substrate-binding protein [Bordetella pertussis]CFL91634.1 substrate-binding protein [Bordetella pertussis]CFM04711.1 substrate-binding protein [Bordetella pertussis]CFM06967.1 substrate-binding protein [Bordetella pertussis]
MQAWHREGAWTAMTAKWARDVAFDVYLDQEVPDCHG